MTYIKKTVLVKHNDVTIATQGSINFLDGTNATFVVNDDVPNEHVDVQLNAGAPSMGGTSTTGLTTALPATAAALGTVTTSIWGCVS